MKLIVTQNTHIQKLETQLLAMNTDVDQTSYLSTSQYGKSSVRQELKMPDFYNISKRFEQSEARTETFQDIFRFS